MIESIELEQCTGCGICDAVCPADVIHMEPVAVPVEIEADGIERYPQEAEAAAYFCCLEALQNAAKYANAGWVVVRLSHADGTLAFIVEDGGVGFDPASTPRGSGLQNMADRVEALGGLLEVRSAPGEGTIVSGHVPARAMEGVG